MKDLNLDASQWKSVSDFYGDVFKAIGAPDWHGKNVNALVDSIIYGGINAVSPPYSIRISGAKNLPANVMREVELARDALSEAREDYRIARHSDIEVEFLVDDF